MHWLKFQIFVKDTNKDTNFASLSESQRKSLSESQKKSSLDSDGIVLAENETSKERFFSGRLWWPISFVEGFPW